MAIVQAKETFEVEGRVVRVGETFDESHPVVRAHPDAFEPARRVEDMSVEPGGGRVR